MVDTISTDKSLLERVNEFKPCVLEGEAVNDLLGGNHLNGEPFVIDSREALALTEESIFSLSSLLFNKVQDIPLGRGAKTAFLMHSLGTNNDNVILHEQFHLRKIFAIRPHLIDETSIKIFFATKPEMNGEIGVIGYTFLPLSPGQPYTLLEYAQISLAPARPSKEDYLQIEEFTRLRSFEMEEIYSVLKMLKAKPKGSIRNYVIRSLEDHSWARSVTQSDIDNWARKDLLAKLENSN